MILYNTIVGLAAGVGLILVAKLLKQFTNGEQIEPEGFALAFGITGFIQTVLGLTVSIMWPCTKVLHANILMASRRSHLECCSLPPRFSCGTSGSRRYAWTK